MSDERASRAPLLLPLAAWACLALGVGLLGLLARAPGPGAAAFILVPPVALALALRVSPAVKAAALALDLRVPVLWNTVRAPIGLLLLAAHARGELPGAFAIHAGWGDFAAGVLAIGAARAAMVHTRESRRLLAAWNVLAFADMLLVVASAQWLILVVEDPLMARVASAPWSLLPAFFVPAVLMSHVLVFQHLAARRRNARRRAGEAAA